MKSGRCRADNTLTETPVYVYEKDASGNIIKNPNGTDKIEKNSDGTFKTEKNLDGSVKMVVTGFTEAETTRVCETE